MSSIQRIRAVVTGIETHMNMWTPKIQCDDCGTQYHARGLAPFDSLHDPAKVDRVIRENGWDIVDGRHICPECTSARPHRQMGSG